MSDLTFEQRAVGAVVGTFISDAAGVPVHWIYDDDLMAEVVNSYPQPEFIPKPHSPYFSIPTGKNSGNGDMAYVLMQSLIACEGYNREDYKKRILEFFGRDSEYELDLGHPGPVTKDDMPIQGPWRPKSIKALMGDVQKMDTGHGDIFGKVTPLVALYAGTPKLAEYVRDMTAVLQDDEQSLGCAVAAAAIIEHYVLHGPNPDAVSKVISQLDGQVVTFLRDVLAAIDRNHKEVVAEFGKACPLPGSFKNSVHCVAQSDGDFVTTVRKTMIAGGDSVCRSAYTGACMGAQVGLDGLPKEWIEKTDRGEEVIVLSERLVALRNKVIN